MATQTNNTNYEREIQLILFTLIVGLGFFKINELNSFVEIISNMVVKPKLLPIVLVGFSVIIYFIYVASIGIGLYLFIFKKKTTYKAAAISLACFFLFYFLVLVNKLNDTNLTFQSSQPYQISGLNCITSINGSIDNWLYGTDKTIKLGTTINSSYVYFGESSVDKTGNFNISALFQPAVSLLIPIDSMFSGHTLSNRSARIISQKVQMGIFLANAPTPFIEVNKQMKSVNGVDTIGDFSIYFTYVDQDVSISDSSTKNNNSVIIQCDLKLKSGWNKIVQTIIAKSSTTITYELSNNEPLGGKWK